MIPVLGRKLFGAIGEKCVFVQQYDPFTGIPSAVSLEGEQDAYGPAMLSVLEYTSRMYGVHIEGEKLYWGGVPGNKCIYEQQWGEKLFRLENTGEKITAYINGRKKFVTESDRKVITDLSGQILEVKPYRKEEI